MAQATLPARAAGVRPLDVVLSCIVVFAVAVAQPLLDLLGRNAEFFLARSAPPLDIVAVALLLAIGIPLLLGLIAVGIGRIHEPTGRVVHAVVLTVLGGLLALHVIGSTPLRGLPGWLEIALALGIGALLPLAFARSETFRSVLRFGAIAPIAFVGLFLFASSASQLVFRAPALAETGVAVGDPAPVVFVVFDEFPVASLMDGDGNLQEEVYPNFARLARDGTWYRNATSVQQQTEAALPAILTGTDPPDGRLPMAFDYPANLFSLLSETYDIRATETVTEMCPEYACENSSRPALPASARWRTLADDLRIVAGHLFLPDDMTGGLPPIDHSWSNFGAGVDPGAADFNIIARFNENVDADRRVAADRFVDDLGSSTGEPRLDFLHALLPHIPWNYLPSGQSYAPTSPHPASKTTGWGDDEWLVDQAYQQHLVQVQYADTIVGRIIEKLEAAGTYDESLIVILADHGVIVRPNIVHRRVATEETIGDIAAVPLFVKVPGQAAGGPDDYRAETIDVLPTVADALDIDVPWDMDGTSLIAAERPERTESQITGDQGVITFGVDGSEARAVAARKIDHFGTEGPFGLAPPGQADLLGTPIADLEIGEDSGLVARLREGNLLGDVDLEAAFLPVLVRALLVPDVDIDETVVAIGLNGEIVAVTRSYVNADGDTAFYSLLPPDALVEGSNDLELFVVDGAGTERTLQPIG